MFQRCYRATVASVLVALSPASVSAQDFSQFIGFGDSSIDSGWYRTPGFPPLGGAPFNAAFPAAVANGGGKPTTSPGLMVSEDLASLLGLSAIPANQPGGTNYATSGARNALVNTPGSGLFNGAVPTITQINGYLAANGGAADGQALYLISSGANDISFALDDPFGTLPTTASKESYVVNQSNALVASIAALQAAGAETIIVPNKPESFGNAATRNLRELMNDTVWDGLASAGVNFIPADVNAVRLAIAADPAAFGFQFITTANPACAGGIHALLCTSLTLVSPDAPQTHLFADGEHLTTAGQKVLSDYYYSLLTAPSQISMLAESAVKARHRLTDGVQEQLEASAQLPRGTRGLNAWVSGEASRLAIDNYPGFPDDPGTPLALAAGFDIAPVPGLILGAGVSAGTQRSTFGNGGDFRQQEIAGIIYAAYASGPLWGSVVGAWGSLDYDVDRDVPVGITVQRNHGETDGHNLSIAIEAGWRYSHGGVTHGPVIGLVWQRAEIDGFTESGSFTSLSFGDQSRTSTVSTLGYRASVDLGTFRPFAQVVWNHEFSGDRNITAALTTTDAPAWYAPAVRIGQDWGTATIGTTVRVAPAANLLASFTSEFGGQDVTTYGGRLGLNVAF